MPDGRPGTGHGRPAGHPARRHRPGLRGTGHPGCRDAAAGRRPGRGRLRPGGSLHRGDRRHRSQGSGRQGNGCLPDHCLSDHCQPYGGRPSAGRRRACGRGRAGRHSRLSGWFRPPASRPRMTCVVPRCRPGENRRATWPAWPTAELPCSVRRWPPEGRPLRGERQIPGTHSRPARLLAPGKLPVRGTCRCLVRYPPGCSGRRGFRPRCRSPRPRSPGSENRIPLGHAGRAPRHGGCRMCWCGGPCVRRRRAARHQPGQRYYRQSARHQSGLRHCRQSGLRHCRRAVRYPCH